MKFMIVDDPAAVRTIARKTLRQAGCERHDISEAEHGAMTLAAIQVAVPHLTRSDWSMPSMTGIALRERLGADGVTIESGFVTTGATPGRKMRASSAGATLRIPTPFTRDAFQEALAPAPGTFAPVSL